MFVCVSERSDIRRDQPAIICGCHERTVNFLHIQCAVIQSFTHTQSELHFLPALANFTFFYSILLPFFSFASLTRSTMPSAMVDTIRKGKTTKRKINHISFYYSSKLAGSDLFLFLLFLTAVAAAINLFDHTNCVMITKHYHRRMRNAFY